MHGALTVALSGALLAGTTGVQDPCVGVWTVDDVYLAVHASGRVVEHAQDAAGEWSTAEVAPLAGSQLAEPVLVGPLLAAVQSKEGLHYVNDAGFFHTGGTPEGPFARYETRMAGHDHGPHFRDRLDHGAITRASRWIVLRLDGPSLGLFECRAGGLRPARIGEGSIVPASDVDPSGRIVTAHFDAASEWRRFELWTPARDGVRVDAMRAVALGGWCTRAVVTGPPGNPSVLIADEQIPGRRHPVELVRFACAGERLVPAHRARIQTNVGFGPQDVRVAGGRLFATSGGACVAALDPESLETLWEWPGRGSGAAFTHTWLGAEGDTLLVYGSVDAFALSPADGRRLDKRAPPPNLFDVWNRGRAGELIGRTRHADVVTRPTGERSVETSYTVVAVRDGGDWAVLHEFE